MALGCPFVVRASARIAPPERRYGLKPALRTRTPAHRTRTNPRAACRQPMAPKPFPGRPPRAVRPPAVLALRGSVGSRSRDGSRVDIPDHRRLLTGGPDAG